MSAPSAELDLELLARLTRARRGARTLREAAVEAGVNYATLQRVEHHSTPDLLVFARLCAWLDVSPEQFLGGAREPAGFMVGFRDERGWSVEATTDGELLTRVEADVDAAVARAVMPRFDWRVLAVWETRNG